jgi:hypothetical protein
MFRDFKQTMIKEFDMTNIPNRYSHIIPQKSLMHGKKERKLVASSLFLFKAA